MASAAGPTTGLPTGISTMASGAGLGMGACEGARASSYLGAGAYSSAPGLTRIPARARAAASSTDRAFSLTASTWSLSCKILRPVRTQSCQSACELQQ
jgi:hypothetical protein